MRRDGKSFMLEIGKMNDRDHGVQIQVIQVYKSVDYRQSVHPLKTAKQIFQEAGRFLRGVRFKKKRGEERRGVGKGVLLRGRWETSALMCLPRQRERERGVVGEKRLQKQEIVGNK